MKNLKGKFTRTARFEIRFSNVEKKLFDEYSKFLGLNRSKLARNIILKQAIKGLKNAKL